MELETIRFADHYQYHYSDLENIRERFRNIVGRNNIIVTTGKDLSRIIGTPLFDTLKGLPLYVQEIETNFYREDKKAFNKQIMEYAGKNQTKH